MEYELAELRAQLRERMQQVTQDQKVQSVMQQDKEEDEDSDVQEMPPRQLHGTRGTPSAFSFLTAANRQQQPEEEEEAQGATHGARSRNGRVWEEAEDMAEDSDRELEEDRRPAKRPRETMAPSLRSNVENAKKLRIQEAAATPLLHTTPQSQAQPKQSARDPFAAVRAPPIPQQPTHAQQNQERRCPGQPKTEMVQNPQPRPPPAEIQKPKEEDPEKVKARLEAYQDDFMQVMEDFDKNIRRHEAHQERLYPSLTPAEQLAQIQREEGILRGRFARQAFDVLNDGLREKEETDAVRRMWENEDPWEEIRFQRRFIQEQWLAESLKGHHSVEATEARYAAYRAQQQRLAAAQQKHAEEQQMQRAVRRDCEPPKNKVPPAVAHAQKRSRPPPPRPRAPVGLEEEPVDPPVQRAQPQGQVPPPPPPPVRQAEPWRPPRPQAPCPHQRVKALVAQRYKRSHQ